MKRLVGKLNVELLFVLVQACLYSAFLILDLTGGNIGLSNKIKYTVIILCFLYALLVRKSTLSGRRDAFSVNGVFRSTFFYTLLALFFTLLSDLFILLLDYYLYGVMVFILVQQLYGMRLILLKHGGVRLGMERFLLQLMSAAMVCFVLFLAEVEMEALLVLSVFYFVCIVFNGIDAVALALRDRRNRSNLLYAVGMVLFLLCDINVGLFNLSGFLAIPAAVYAVVYSLSSLLMWFFYAPAQVLIALSTKYIQSE